MSGQFFITESDINNVLGDKTRAHFSKEKLQQLNFYVKVTVIETSVALNDYLKEQKDIKVVVLTDLFMFTNDKLNDISQTCRSNKTALINTSQNGLFGRVFNDFGEEFCVLDKDGEELQEVMIKDISYNEKKDGTVVTLLEGFKHRFEDGDQVVINEVLGMVAQSEEGSLSTETVNEKVVSVKVINP